MSLRTVIQSAIKTASKTVESLKTVVTLEQFTGQSRTGSKTYSSTITLKAIVDRTNKLVMKGGQFVNVAATVTFLDKIPANGAVTVPPRVEPIDSRDRITLSDGYTGTIISSPNATEDPSTGTGYVIKVVLG